MKAYELIIFDWDGTLLDSAGQIVASMQYAISDLDLPARQDHEISRLIGLGLEDAFLRLFPELDTTTLLALLEKYRDRYSSANKSYGDAFPGVESTLLELKSGGWNLAVATGKSRRGLDRAMAATGWHSHFVATRCADETAAKPQPLMLEELLDELELSAERALMVGDTSYDMEMAQRAGMDALGVAWGVHEQHELEAAGAQIVLPGVDHLPAWLRGQL